MNLKKYLIIIPYLFLLFIIFLFSAHYHNDLLDHDDCALCILKNFVFIAIIIISFFCLSLSYLIIVYYCFYYIILKKSIHIDYHLRSPPVFTVFN